MASGAHARACSQRAAPAALPVQASSYEFRNVADFGCTDDEYWNRSGHLYLSDERQADRQRLTDSGRSRFLMVMTAVGFSFNPSWQSTQSVASRGREWWPSVDHRGPDRAVPAAASPDGRAARRRPQDRNSVTVLLPDGRAAFAPPRSPRRQASFTRWKMGGVSPARRLDDYYARGCRTASGLSHSRPTATSSVARRNQPPSFVVFRWPRDDLCERPGTISARESR
ncbi:MAG: hypothetical protein Udaeo2_22920 [Candidatus Udaeobacter sp.]|nr:MAG: hypothetical protein Udaeo2_22920 [Candidatus Udaeobacter sp.]